MDFPTLEQLKARTTRKWTVYDEDIIPLWIAESDFPTAPAVKANITRMVEQEAFGYTPASSDLPEALADFYQQRYGWRPDPTKVRPVPDVVRGMVLAVQHFTRPGSEVVVPVPAYPPFNELPEAAGRGKVEIGSEDGIDLAEVEGAFKAGAGSILLANPNNPFGYVYDEDFLRGLVNIAHKYDARVIVDEIHAPVVLDGDHVVAASISKTAAEVCLTVTATSKAWNIAGLKCAQMIFTNDADVKTWSSLPGVSKDGTGTLGIFAAAACYREGVGYLDEQIDYLRGNLDWLMEALPAAVPGIGVVRPSATYLLWLDFSGTAIGDLEHPAAWLREHARVALNEGTTFGPGGEHHARLNFATSRELLTEAVDRMAKAFAAA